MRNEAFRQAVHRAVDEPAKHLPDDPFLASRILAQANGKETQIMKKKLPIGVIVVLILICMSVTAVAVGMTVYEIWQDSFDKMNTTGVINIITDPGEDDMPVDEAIAIARDAIKQKYAATDAELNTMGVYPNFIGREWEWSDGTQPDEWQIFISSRTNMDIDLATDKYGAAGEYRVYINAETKEVTYCNWYTEDFWAHAQRIWDIGNHDLVYSYYKGNTFYTQPPEEQARWEALFVAEGYELRSRDTLYQDLLFRGGTDLLFREWDEYALVADDPQAIAAWQVLDEQFCLDKALLEKYYFRAGRLGMHTGTDDVFIAYSYNWAEAPEVMEANWIVSSMSHDVKRLGIYLISFAPGTTDVQAVTHLLESTHHRLEPVTEGLPLQKTDWTADDLLFYDKAVTAYVAAYERLLSADATTGERELVRQAVMRYLGGDPEWYPKTSEGYDVSMWFSDETAPAHSTLRDQELAAMDERQRMRTEAEAQYGDNWDLWPLDVQARVLGEPFYDRREGELTRDEAIEKAKAALIAQEGKSAVNENGLIGVRLNRDLGEGGEYSRWMVTFFPSATTDGWWVEFFDTGAEWMGTEITITNFSEGIG